ncbi:hypothetical protein C8Q76DRAFT_693642 [Earliella scabrosa]|nr:hypothetical protein C8Q76DRAFT_693642 [Earliella scabrosa]
MSTPPESSVDHLRSTLYESIPFCSGTLEVTSRDLVLYYGKDAAATRIDLSHVSPDELAVLQKRCQGSIPGQDDQMVADASHSRVGRMHPDSFMIGFDPERNGLIDAIRATLLPRDDELDHVDAVLHELNVYGPDASLRPQQDSPPAANVFGSMVVILPTPHEGGSLLLRHDGSEWSIDSADILCNSESSTRVAFVAFFSDVEHEVMPVTSGHRVTLTYHFYFPASPSRGTAPSPPSGLQIIQPSGASSYKVTSALSLFLEDWTILPKGGLLAFGLRHTYPLPKSWVTGDPNPLADLQRWLKGSDAALWHACRFHGLQPTLRVAVLDDHLGPVLLDRFSELDRFQSDSERDGPLRALLDGSGGRVMLCEPLGREPTQREHGYMMATASPWVRALERGKRVTAHLVTPITKFNRVKTSHVQYGSWEVPPTLGLLYQYVCLTVEIGPAGQRREVVVDEDELDEEMEYSGEEDDA